MLTTGGWHQRLSLIRPCHAWTSSSRSATTTRSRTATRYFYVAPRHSLFQPSSSPPITATFQRGHATTCPARTSSSQLEMSTKPASPVDATITTETETATEATKMINLHTIPVEELEVILKSWGHPKYRAQQISDWIRVQGASNIDEMQNIPKALKAQLKEHATMGSLQLHTELISKDGTIKRAYRLADGQLIESVLMPYSDGRYTACISSQAGCAQGCVFCATGQMGFSRQLSPDEILEQVSRFSSELAAIDKQERKEQEADNKKKGNKQKSGAKTSSAPTKNHGRSTRLSNIVFMGSKYKYQK
jgi:hypothetical protein